MAKLRREIAGMAHRPGRPSAPAPPAATCRRSPSPGYTNAGKSSLLNRLTGAGVLVEDALFATLDPTVRRADDARTAARYTLTDTVGFVRHLPHQLVEAFRSTLEEVGRRRPDPARRRRLRPRPEAQIAAVREVLGEIGAASVPELIVINKVRRRRPDRGRARCGAASGDCVLVSARTGAGLDELRDAARGGAAAPRPRGPGAVPYSRGDLVARVHAGGRGLAGSARRRRHRAGGPGPRPAWPPSSSSSAHLLPINGQPLLNIEQSRRDGPWSIAPVGVAAIGGRHSAPARPPTQVQAGCRSRIVASAGARPPRLFCRCLRYVNVLGCRSGPANRSRLSSLIVRITGLAKADENG